MRVLTLFIRPRSPLSEDEEVVSIRAIIVPFSISVPSVGSNLIIRPLVSAETITSVLQSYQMHLPDQVCFCSLPRSIAAMIINVLVFILLYVINDFQFIYHLSQISSGLFYFLSAYIQIFHFCQCKIYFMNFIVDHCLLFGIHFI